MLLRAEAHNWLGQAELACKSARRAMALFPAGGGPWSEAANHLVWGLGETGDFEGIAIVADEVARYVSEPDQASQLIALAWAAANLMQGGNAGGAWSGS